jgi:hypothetical protein
MNPSAISGRWVTLPLLRYTEREEDMNIMAPSKDNLSRFSGTLWLTIWIFVILTAVFFFMSEQKKRLIVPMSYVNNLSRWLKNYANHRMTSRAWRGHM